MAENIDTSDIEFDLALTSSELIAISNEKIEMIQGLVSDRGKKSIIGQLVKKTGKSIPSTHLKICQTSKVDEFYEVMDDLLDFIVDKPFYGQFNLTIGIFSYNAFCVPFVLNKDQIIKIGKLALSVQVYFYPE